SRQEIVQGQASPIFPGWHPCILVERNDEAQGMDEVRGIVQQETAFMERFVNKSKVTVLQVTQPAVNQLGGGTAGPGREISFVNECHAQAAQHRIQGDAGSGDAAAKDQKIETCLSESCDGPLHTVFYLAVRNHALARPASEDAQRTQPLNA